MISLLAVGQVAALRFTRELSPTELAVYSILCLVSSTILYSLYSLYIYPAFFSPLGKLPLAPGGYGPLGHSHAKFKAPNDASLEKWLEDYSEHDLFRVREAFGCDAVVATSPAILKAVLLENPYSFTKAAGIRRILKLVLGEGLIVVEGDAHKFQKSVLKSSFGLGPIKDLHPLFWKKSVDLLVALGASFKGASSASRVEFNTWCERITLDMIGYASM